MSSIYANPIQVNNADECYFYHTMEIPELGTLYGDWDLRGVTDEYLGKLDYSGKRVLEIGPASGYLTFEMEKRGGHVVSVELGDDPNWDLAPYPEHVLAVYRRAILDSTARLKKGYWLAHAANKSRAKVCYGSAYNLPCELEHFDIAIMTDVLLHTRNPLTIVEQCARRSNCVVIAETDRPDLRGQPVMRLIPDGDNSSWSAGAWWYFSPDLFKNYLAVMGFSEFAEYSHVPTFRGQPSEHFTVVARRANESIV